MNFIEISNPISNELDCINDSNPSLITITPPSPPKNQYLNEETILLNKPGDANLVLNNCNKNIDNYNEIIADNMNDLNDKYNEEIIIENLISDPLDSFPAHIDNENFDYEEPQICFLDEDNNYSNLEINYKDINDFKPIDDISLNNDDSKYRGWHGLRNVSNTLPHSNETAPLNIPKSDSLNTSRFSLQKNSSLSNLFIKVDNMGFIENLEPPTPTEDISPFFPTFLTYNKYLDPKIKNELDFISSSSVKNIPERIWNYFDMKEQQDKLNFKLRISISLLYENYRKILKYSVPPSEDSIVNISKLLYDCYHFEQGTVYIPIISFIVAAIIYIFVISLFYDRSFFLSLILHLFIFIIFIFTGIFNEINRPFSHKVIEKHQLIQEQLSTLKTNVKKVNTFVKYLFSLLLEVQLVSKGYQVDLPINYGICSNIDWNNYVDISTPIRNFEEIRITLLNVLTKLNTFSEICIEFLGIHIDLEREYADFENNSSIFKDKLENIKDDFSNSFDSSKSTHSHTIKYLQYKHYEFENNIKTLSDLLIRLFQQSQDIYSFSNQFVIRSFDTLLNSPIMELKSVFEFSIEELELGMNKLVGFGYDELASSFSKKIQEAPSQVFFQEYSLNRINSALSDIRARLNLLQDLGYKLRLNNSSYSDCIQCFNSIRNESFDNLKKTIDEVGLLILPNYNLLSETKNTNSELSKELKNQRYEDDQHTIKSDTYESDVKEDSHFSVDYTHEHTLQSFDDVKEIIQKKTDVFILETPTIQIETKSEQLKGIQLPKKSDLENSQRRKIVPLQQVEENSSDDDTNFICKPNDSFLVNPKQVSLSTQEKKVIPLIHNLSSKSSPKDKLMSEMKSVLEKRTREYQYHYINDLKSLNTTLD